jgi:AraC-like DNA-binding protein/mannose-6-phosphate isomerase-like protein (cupin superfamily)
MRTTHARHDETIARAARHRYASGAPPTRPAEMPLRLWAVPHIQGFDIQDGIPPLPQSPPHFHHAFEIGFVTKGIASVTGFGERRIVGADTYTLVPPGQVHVARWESERPEPCVFFVSPSLVDEARRSVTKREASYRDFSSHSEAVVGALRRVYEAVVRRAPTLEQQEGLLEALVLVEQRRSARETKDFKPEPAAARIVRDYLESHFRHNVTLDQLAALTPLSRFHLVRVFRRAMGLPPHAYQSHLRLLHAQAALRSGSTISAAALDAGFADQSHLTRYFKRFLGVTPGDYMNHSASARVPATAPESPSLLALS